MTKTESGDGNKHAQSVLAALVSLREATAAALAETSGVPYSTTNKKLRSLEAAGLAEARRGEDTKVRWKPTDAALAHDPPAGDKDAVAQDHTPEEQGDTHQADEPEEAATPGATGGHTETAKADQPSTAGEEPPPSASIAAPTTGAPSHPAADGSNASESGDGAPGAASGNERGRRRQGALYEQTLAVLRRSPDRTFTVAAVCKEIDASRADSGTASASPGAVYNALAKAVSKGAIRQVLARPATFQALLGPGPTEEAGRR